jgi:predicted RNA-binding protein YlxR (DUF448 family)
MGRAEDSVRTCVGCSEEDHPLKMERFVFIDDMGLLHDVRRKAPGRGAYVHPSGKCLEGAVKRGFARGFRRKVATPGVAALAADMADGIRRRLVDRLRAASRGGTVFVGGRETDEGFLRDQVALLLIARDAGESTRKKYGSNADRKGIPVETAAFDAAELGALVGRERVALFGLDPTHAEFVANDLSKLDELERVGG